MAVCKISENKPKKQRGGNWPGDSSRTEKQRGCSGGDRGGKPGRKGPSSVASAVRTTGVWENSKAARTKGGLTKTLQKGVVRGEKKKKKKGVKNKSTKRRSSDETTTTIRRESLAKNNKKKSWA